MANYQQGKYTPNNPEKYIGKKQPVYRSGWELVFMRWCDNTANILGWSSEDQVIPYMNPITGKRHNYIPDFLIVYIDAQGKKHAEVVEIKPSSQIQGNAKSNHDRIHAVVNEAKWRYARQWAAAQGMKFTIITENEIYNKPQKPKAQRGKRKKR